MKRMILAAGAAMALAGTLSLRALLSDNTNKAIAAPASDVAADVIDLKLPKPAYIGTPSNLPKHIELPPPPEKARRTWKAPHGTALLSRGKPVISSEKDPGFGQVAMVTDGDKEGMDGSEVELAAGKQWVQIDLGRTQQITGILIWHSHRHASAYRDVVIQISDDADFISDVTTVFNNDIDNSSGFGLGRNREYLESFQGKLIEVAALKARYVRCHVNGNIFSDQSHYTEVEVYGIPAK